MKQIGETEEKKISVRLRVRQTIINFPEDTTSVTSRVRKNLFGYEEVFPRPASVPFDLRLYRPSP
jgi:hypothetical protein